MKLLLATLLLLKAIGCDSFVVSYRTGARCWRSARIVGGETAADSDLPGDDEAGALPISVATIPLDALGVDAHVVGVLHSTPSSADDAATTVRATRPASVVLELCAPRWRSLLNVRAREKRQRDAAETPPTLGVLARQWYDSMGDATRDLGPVPGLISGE